MRSPVRTNCACTLSSTRALLSACRRPSSRYFAKCDVRQYFASVRHDVSLNLLSPYAGDAWSKELLRSLVESWSDAPGLGMPIGNLTSQLFANAYLVAVDLDMTRTHGTRCYLRYVDDFLWFGEDKSQLGRHISSLQRELERVGLALHPRKTRIAPVSEGVDFAGLVAFADGMRLRGRSKRRALRLLSERRRAFRRGKISEDQYLARMSGSGAFCRTE